MLVGGSVGAGPARPQARTQSLREFLSRLLRWSQMDTECASWTMLYICIAPSKVYRNSTWHKVTKHQWARDDPAFVVIQAALLLFSSLAWAIAYGHHSIIAFLRAITWSLFLDFLLVGLLIATLGWFISNHYLLTDGLHRVEQKVEWLYAFEVHCNGFFAVFLLLHVGQYFASPLLTLPSWVATLVGNCVYALAYTYYFYVTFLGYQVLPFLHNTQVFLYPIGLIVMAWVVLAIFRVNLCILAINLYFFNT
eukprot:TRINITY_DN24543_c0_g1_i1.p1 TRINITY_DN24543_c0_g1~~TRINITY_DN24543_c0_g1_i1.p1  ORF type:complete len:251 (-),score=45.67 TRINITY_DN24543_c0_g1_i1:48-800(-)